MLLTEHLNDGATRLGVQIEGPICPASPPVHHFPPRTMLWYFLTIEVASSIRAHGLIKGGLFHLPHKGHIAFHVPRVESTPVDRLNIMEAGDPADSPKDAHLEDQTRFSTYPS